MRKIIGEFLIGRKRKKRTLFLKKSTFKIIYTAYKTIHLIFFLGCLGKDSKANVITLKMSNIILLKVSDFFLLTYRKVRSLIIKSLKNILANVTSKDEIWNPLKIVQEFYRDLVYIVESTVKHLCVPIYTHIYKFKDYKEKSGASFLDKGKRFHLNVSSYKEHILVSFFDTLEQNIKEYNDEECIHIIKLLNFYINDVGLKFSQNCLENSIMKILEVCMNFQKEDLVKFQFLYPAFELALKINDILGNEGQIEVKGVGPNILAPNKTFNEILQKFSDLFSLMVDELSNSNEVDKFVNLFTNFSKILVTIQRFLDVKEMEQLPMWFELIVKCLRNQNKQICIRAIETIVDIMSSREKDDIYSNLHDL